MTAHRNRFAWLPLVLAVALGTDVAGRGAQGKPKTERVVLQEFQAGIDAYMAIHARFEKDHPEAKTADTPEKIREARRALAAKIRAERRNPRQGDIFNPEVRTVFRRRLRRELEGPQGPDITLVLNDESAKWFPPRVHAEYPEGWPVTTVPQAILAVLPKLPEDLEYRFVGNDLILHDVHANLIVDFIKNAIR